MKEDEFINCPHCGKLTTTVTGSCKHCGKLLTQTFISKIPSNKKNNSLTLLIIIIIGLISITYFMFKPKSDDETLEHALTMIEQYYEYYNIEDYDKIKEMLVDKQTKNGQSFREIHLTRIKQFRDMFGRYLGYKYPNEPIKNIVIPEDTDKSELVKLHTELAKKYGKNIFEDKYCLKNRYDYLQSKNSDKPLEICITRKFENSEDNYTFLFIQTQNGLKIFLTPEFYSK